jgi:hypothetical protein
MVDVVKKKGNTLKYWYKYVAVLSGSYIYFYNYDDDQIIEEVVAYFQQGQSRKTSTTIQNVEEDKSDNDDNISHSEGISMTLNSEESDMAPE